MNINIYVQWRVDRKIDRLFSYLKVHKDISGENEFSSMAKVETTNRTYTLGNATENTSWNILYSYPDFGRIRWKILKMMGALNRALRIGSNFLG